MPLKITKDTALSLKRYAKCQTTPEWEVFIFEAQDKWEDLQAQATLKIMQEGGNSNNQDDDDEDGFICEGKPVFTNSSGLVRWTRTSSKPSWIKVTPRIQTR